MICSVVYLVFIMPFFLDRSKLRTPAIPMPALPIFSNRQNSFPETLPHTGISPNFFMPCNAVGKALRDGERGVIIMVAPT